MVLSRQIRQTLDIGLTQSGIDDFALVPQSARDSLVKYVQLLAKWNRVYNLTAIRDPVAMVHRHLLDSLVLCRWLPRQAAGTDNADVIDVGSGAGLPVLPLSILRPDLAFVSIESNGKKIRFQRQVLVELALENVDIRHQRVQDTQAKAEIVTSRAFTAPEEFLQIASPLCSLSGRIIIMLTHTDKLPEPLPAGFALQELVALDIPGSKVPRHIAVCRRCP